MAQPCNTATGSPWPLMLLLWAQTPYQQPRGIDEFRANIARKEARDCWICLRSGPQHLPRRSNESRIITDKKVWLFCQGMHKVCWSKLKTSVFPAFSCMFYHVLSSYSIPHGCSGVPRGAAWCYSSSLRHLQVPDFQCSDSFGSDELHAGWLRRLENWMKSYILLFFLLLLLILLLNNYKYTHNYIYIYI